MHIRVGVKYSTCTWYLYLRTYLSVLDVLEYLVYGNVKVLVLVLVLDQKVLGTWHVIFKYYSLKSVKVANYLRASDVNLSNYNSCTRAELAKIKLPFDALQFENVDCTSHRKDIDLFYYNIINTLINCTKRCIPVLKVHKNNYIAGWNEHFSY